MRASSPIVRGRPRPGQSPSVALWRRRLRRSTRKRLIPPVGAAAIENEGTGGALIEQDCPPVRVMRAFEAMHVTEPKPGRADLRPWPEFFRLAEHPPARPSGETAIKLITGRAARRPRPVTQKIPARPSPLPTSRAATPRNHGIRDSPTPASATSRRREHRRADQTSREYPRRPARRWLVLMLERAAHRIHDLILAAIRSNMQSVLTDCPHT